MLTAKSDGTVRSYELIQQHGTEKKGVHRELMTSYITTERKVYTLFMKHCHKHIKYRNPYFPL